MLATVSAHAPRGLAAAAALTALGLLAMGCPPDTPWRSALYPLSWFPGWRDAQGRGLQDFSWAGYARGERPVPAPAGPLVDVTAAPYGADPSGTSDATAAIQRALDDVGRAGGGVVYLPPGTYRVAPGSAQAALVIQHSRVVLRGAGPAATRLLNAQTAMRLKEVVRVSPFADHDHWWAWAAGPLTPLARDVHEPTRTIPLASVAGLAPGDWVVLRSEVTPAFAQEHGMAGRWDQRHGAIVFYRRVEAVDPAARTIEVDIPTRYPLLVRDQAGVHRAPPHLEEVGVEELSIGMQEVDPARLGDDDWDRPGTTAWEVHASAALAVNHVVNGWVRNVHSWQPPGNRSGAHLLSNGICLRAARSISVEGCELARPVYRGAGGNGYLFVMQGADNLVRRCRARRGRHNFSFSLFGTTGNVITQCESEESSLDCDYHQLLSPSNLVDAMLLRKDRWSAVYRDHAEHGQTATRCVFWNLRGDGFGSLSRRALLYTGQWGLGYAIGTSGTPSAIEAPTDHGTGPRDHVEGEGRGAGLSPRSLYEDQLARRLSLPDHDLPEVLAPGQTWQAAVTVRNTGPVAWSAADGFRLGAVDDSDGLAGQLRVDLPPGLTVPPGGTHTFRFTLTAPAQPGVHVTDWRMLREGVEWFGGVAGALVTVR